MDLLTAIVLGVVQGITEFLPISSSGHLVIAQHLLGWKEPAIFFDVSLHIGTLLAVFAIFWQDITELVKGAIHLIFKRSGAEKRTIEINERVFLLVVIGTMPTVFLGLFTRHFLEAAFSSVAAVSVNLLITGTFLWLTRYAATLRPKSIPLTRGRHALWIGLAQGLALAPGISRSGTTISAGLFLGLERDWAGRFSFLLFVPAVLGALILESSHIETSQIQILPTLSGVVAAALTGYVALRILLKIVRRGSFYIFAPYCWGLGLIGLASSLLFHGF